jgi:membrane-associated phospholipid phosphatase
VTPLRTRLTWAIIAVALLAVATAIDPWAYHHLVWLPVYDTDWGKALRSVGYWPLWIVIALALWMNDPRSPLERWRAATLAVSVTAAGLLGELLKMLLRRERPGAHDGAYVFRAFTDRPFDTRGIGSPSSHAFLAFAAAATLARFYPKAAPIWYGLAVGCAVTRVLSRAHFVSDVVAGALLGILVAAVVPRAFHRGKSTTR